VVATSGTTGEPKGVELTAAGLRASGAAVHAAVAPDPDAVWLCCLPLQYVAGLAVVGRAWATGSPWAVHDAFDPAAIADVAGKAPVVVSLVPTMLSRLLAAGTDTAGIDHVLLGGGMIDPALLTAARDAGIAVSTTYGLTETWGGVVHDGHPLDGVELRLDGPAGTAEGEIWVRAPMVMRGYRLDPDGTRAALDGDGWFHTGDIARHDGQRLWIVDRLRDLVKTGGISVSPTEVERVLARHPAVADVCVAGRPDPEWGERVVAFVVPHPGMDVPDLATLRAHAAAELAAPKLPREVVTVAAIPRTPGGKPLRRLLP
jgi:O-succinylbenzoic acid--CoA ligase